MTTFAAALRTARQAHRPPLSQSKLAERAGFYHSYVSRLETGTRLPTREAVVELGAALDLDPDDFDRLLLAAGFAPKGMQKARPADRVAIEVGQALVSGKLPPEVEAHVRALLGVASHLVRGLA